MKSNKGITLVSLVIYVIVMIIVIGVMGAVSSNFYKNTNSMQVDTEEILEFNKFNTYFLKEIKAPKNTVDTIGNEGEYILFESGNSFSFSNNIIYYNILVLGGAPLFFFFLRAFHHAIVLFLGDNPLLL